MARPGKDKSASSANKAQVADEVFTSSATDAKAQGEALTPESIEDAVLEQGASIDELVKKAEAEMIEWRDKFMRLHAEWDTYRRRTAEQRAEERANATEKLVEALLPVIDDFERTIEYAEKNGEKELLDGVRAVQTKFVNTLTKEGVKVLDPKDEAFDALESQAISSYEDAAVPDETVTEVFQKGYKMGRKVLRPAMVKVATGGPKRETEQEESR